MKSVLTIAMDQEDLKALIIDCLKECSFHDQNTNEEPMSQKEAAKYIGVTEPTIIKYKKEGLIPYHQAPGTRKIKFYKSEILEVMKRNRHLLRASRK